MDVASAQHFQTESSEHSQSLSNLLQKASELVQSGKATEAFPLFLEGHRKVDVFYDKWKALVSSGDPAFASWWEQSVKDDRINLLTSEAIAQRWLGNSNEGLKLLTRALDLTTRDTAQHSFLLQSLAGLHYDQQSFSKAEEYCRRAHEEFAKLAATTTEKEYAIQFWTQSTQSLSEAANAAFGRGDFALFEQTLDEAILFAEQHELAQLANSLWIRKVGQMLAVDASGETIQRVKEERRRRSTHRDPDFQYKVSELIATYCSEQSEYGLARQELEEARENVPSNHQWNWFRQLADVSEAEGDLETAIRYSEECLAETRRLGVPMTIAAALRALVPLEATRGDEQSETYLVELRNLGFSDEIKNALVGRSVVYCKSGRFDLAARDLDEAEKVAPGDPNVLMGRVAVFKGLNQKEDALRVTEHAIARLEDHLTRSGVDWKTVLESIAGLQESAAFWSAELGRTDESVIWAERSKCQGRRSRLFEPRATRFDREFDFERLRSRLASESAALVYFCLTGRGCLALLCDGQQSRPQPFVFELTESALQKLLPKQESELWNQGVFASLEPLSKIFAPLLSEVVERKYRKLYIVPDSQLYFIPFYALDVDANSKVIDHCAVSYVPSATQLFWDVRKKEHRTCLAVGALEEQGISLSDQAAEIAQLNWSNSQLIRDATSQEVLDLAANFDVLHFQCHGRVEGTVQGSRAASTLTLTDRVLSAKDIYSLSLSAELVFLNACVSGRFKTRLTNEVGGFWEAFLNAGVNQIVATLTYVNPESAQLLALAFYRYWLKGIECSEALRLAQLEVRKERPMPDDWATHILIGV